MKIIKEAREESGELQQALQNLKQTILKELEPALIPALDKVESILSSLGRIFSRHHKM